MTREKVYSRGAVSEQVSALKVQNEAMTSQNIQNMFRTRRMNWIQLLSENLKIIGYEYTKRKYYYRRVPCHKHSLVGLRSRVTSVEMMDANVQDERQRLRDNLYGGVCVERFVALFAAVFSQRCYKETDHETRVGCVSDRSAPVWKNN